MELNIRTHAGIGDILHAKQLLDEVKDNYEIINIYFDSDCLRDCKGNYEQFNDFTIKLLEELFSEPPYVIKNTLDSVVITPRELCQYVHSKFDTLNLEKYLCKDYINVQKTEEYIVVLTKIRGLHYSNYSSIRERYLDTLNKISKKNRIYIMGERIIGMNRENQIHGPQKIYSIYNDLVQNIDNIKDLTIEELGISASKYEDFLIDCKILNQSKNVICLGVSGGVVTARAISNIINYYGGCEFQEMLDLFPINQNKYLTNNINDFFSRIESLV